MGSMGWDGYTHRIWHNDGDADKATCQPPGFVLSTCWGGFFGAMFYVIIPQPYVYLAFR